MAVQGLTVEQAYDILASWVTVLAEKVRDKPAITKSVGEAKVVLMEEVVTALRYLEDAIKRESTSR